LLWVILKLKTTIVIVSGILEWKILEFEMYSESKGLKRILNNLGSRKRAIPIVKSSLFFMSAKL